MVLVKSLLHEGFCEDDQFLEDSKEKKKKKEVWKDWGSRGRAVLSHVVGSEI